ncbi:MAG: aminotransferase class I/II-fold pyridoxal phosphate-dependent enzyme [Candidatus Melainabacteria bacterium]|nr:aminotransferase class I/II-fold pyridoxal phosphate-dependent enzyme [Candidatus Melainabacteria bacterium]
MSSSKRVETKLIHAGELRPRVHGAVTLPIFQSATYEYGGEDDYHDIRYIRLNNTPNHTVLHAKLAAIEGAEAALVAASGMAAISTTLLSLLSRGDHILLQDCLYGGTHDFVTKDLPALAIEYDFIDASDPASWESKICKNTKAIYVETIANPLMRVPELAAVVEFARSHGIVSLIDNTFASPINFRPAEMGFDLSLHSCTKYLNGHSDIVGGACIGKAVLVKNVTRKLNHLGGTLDPHAAFLLHRGLKTLALRVKHQNESALKIATFLEKHPAVGGVNYPGLKSNPGHASAAKWFDGFGGMLSFELKEHDAEIADQFLKELHLPICAPSLGGVESLITRPATTSHLGLSKEDRKKIGISDALVRFSTGIEATDDLIEDFDQALKKISARAVH